MENAPYSIIPHPVRNRPPVPRANQPKLNAIIKRLDPIEEAPASSQVTPQNKRQPNINLGRAPLLPTI
jgi:hypothetical protein